MSNLSNNILTIIWITILVLIVLMVFDENKKDEIQRDNEMQGKIQQLITHECNSK